MILLAVIVNLLTVIMGIIITQYYYSSKLKAMITKKRELAKILEGTEVAIIEELLQKTVEYVDKYPDKWSPWGVYKSNAGLTSFEFLQEHRGLKITSEGQLRYRNIHGTMKDDDDDSRYIQSFIPLTARQQEIVKDLFIRLQAEHLLRMLDRFGIAEETKKLETAKPKTVV